MKWDVEKLQKFVLDPDWEYMHQFIVEHFDYVSDIQSVDTSRTPENISAQVISSQKIASQLGRLEQSFETVKQLKDKKKVSFK